MIRTPPQHNTVNPPGQVMYHDKPLGQSIEEYKAEEYAKRVYEAWKEGYAEGFAAGTLYERQNILQKPLDK